MPFSLSGLSVFSPLGLWALLALAIPVLIHLFNRSRGRLVRIGHIDLISSIEATGLKIPGDYVPFYDSTIILAEATINQ